MCAPQDAAGLSVRTGDLVRVETEVGWFIDKVWRTERIKPGIIAMSHHLGRWRVQEDDGGSQWVRVGLSGAWLGGVM